MLLQVAIAPAFVWAQRSNGSKATPTRDTSARVTRSDLTFRSACAIAALPD